jgi:UDP-glucose 4-epimerase
MRFLITGGAGFIASALANRLVRDGHEVRAIDNLSAGDPQALDPAVLFTRGDVADIPKLWTLLQDVSCVYHLAARVSVPESIQYPRDYNHVNVGGTVSLMEAIRDAGVQRVVLASSGAVYGSQVEQPLREDMIPNPDSPYAVSKLSAETYVNTIGRLWGIETVSLRIFNTYGPGQQIPASHAPVIPQFLKAARTGASLVVFGDGSQTRDFVHISDIVDALVSAAVAPNINQRVINVGSGVETSLLALIDAVERVVGKRLEPIFNTGRVSGVARMQADLRQARALLDYLPKISLDEGLRRTLEQDPRLAVSA